ncbi:GNAT family N-acetyltransferase [Actinomadura sp. ATCC 31491]|uniref:GNAT family N-acetyltransferase n=1 Tax=Actinomadura luzonensis TaxID=2805427 RepID=A0ABT0FTD8_9ACTN|nr:GNAT family N-acetyltransferase [Actinomadura luzonensis]MCK2215433.1 GNAT family N-acetyltransferase [Actinomadura luzonensis]
MSADYWDGRVSLYHSGRWPDVTPERRLPGGPAGGPALVLDSPFWNGYQRDAGTPAVWDGPMAYLPSLYSVYGPTHLTAPAEIARTLEEAAGRARAHATAGLLVANLPRSCARRWRAVREPDAVIRLDVAYSCDVRDGVDGVLAALPRDERVEWRRRWRRARERGLTMTRDAGRLPEALRLANDSAVRHGIEPLYDAATFAAVAALPGAAVVCADLGGATLAAFLTVEHDGVLHLWAGGIDYAALRAYSPYLFLLYEILAGAPARGVRRVEFGRGSYAFKRRYGFTGTELWSLYYAPGPEAAAAHAPRLAVMHERLAAFMGLR